MINVKTSYNLINARIIVLKGLHRLKNDDISRITGYSVGTIKSWFADPKSKHYRRAPDDAYHKLKKGRSMSVD